MSHFHMKKIGLAIAATLLISGCATSNKNCVPGEMARGCTSMAETYEAALSGSGDRVSLFQKQGEQVKEVQASPLNIQAGQHQVAGPVFHPPKPYRLGIAPWTDANGVLHSGEYIYFTTPGRWSYGPMALPGSAAGVLGPVRPDQLGFTSRDSIMPERDQRERDGVLLPERNFGPQGLR